jgi:transcriptional regulator with XRE-family HTH domain
MPHQMSEPNPVAVHVGAHIKERRVTLGMSQERLGEALGLTFQQIQKYERGDNRVCASRLYGLARVLDVPVSFFFDGLDGIGDPSQDTITMDREASALVRAYYRITGPITRHKVLELIKSMTPPE